LGELRSALAAAVSKFLDVRTIPTLKRAVLKGYINEIAGTLSVLGEADAFEALITNVRDGKLNSSLNRYLVTMIQRSNSPVEPWMNPKIWRDTPAWVSPLAARWMEWWEQHKAEFRIVRSSKEAYKLYGP
jgi:hypothetical protein